MILFPRKITFLGQLLMVILFKSKNTLKRYKEENSQRPPSTFRHSGQREVTLSVHRRLDNILFNWFSADGYLVCFQSFAIINNVTMNNLTYILLHADVTMSQGKLPDMNHSLKGHMHFLF